MFPDEALLPRDTEKAASTAGDAFNRATHCLIISDADGVAAVIVATQPKRSASSVMIFCFMTYLFQHLSELDGLAGG